MDHDLWSTRARLFLEGLMGEGDRAAVEAAGNTFPLAGTGTAAPILAGARRRCRLIGARAGGFERPQDRDAYAGGADATHATQTDFRGTTNTDDDADASEGHSGSFTRRRVTMRSDTPRYHPTAMPIRSDALTAARTVLPA